MGRFWGEIAPFARRPGEGRGPILRDLLMNLGSKDLSQNFTLWLWNPAPVAIAHQAGTTWIWLHLLAAQSARVVRNFPPSQ